MVGVPGLTAPAAAAAGDADGGDDDAAGPPVEEGEAEAVVASAAGGILEPCSRNAPAAICAALKPLEEQGEKRHGDRLRGVGGFGKSRGRK